MYSYEDPEGAPAWAWPQVLLVQVAPFMGVLMGQRLAESRLRRLAGGADGSGGKPQHVTDPPLPLSELRATARSVAKWTWKHYAGKMRTSNLTADDLMPEAFSVLQSNVGKIGMAKRWDDNSEKNGTAGLALSPKGAADYNRRQRQRVSNAMDLCDDISADVCTSGMCLFCACSQWH